MFQDLDTFFEELVTSHREDLHGHLISNIFHFWFVKSPRPLNRIPHIRVRNIGSLHGRYSARKGDGSDFPFWCRSRSGSSRSYTKIYICWQIRKLFDFCSHQCHSSGTVVSLIPYTINKYFQSYQHICNRPAMLSQSIVQHIAVHLLLLCKKKVLTFPSLAEMSLTKLSLTNLSFTVIHICHST